MIPVVRDHSKNQNERAGNAIIYDRLHTQTNECASIWVMADRGHGIMRSKISLTGIAATSLLSFTCTPALAAAGSPHVDPMIAASTGKGEWVTWGGDAGFERYSPLDQINAGNVKTVPDRLARTVAAGPWRAAHPIQ